MGLLEAEDGVLILLTGYRNESEIGRGFVLLPDLLFDLGHFDLAGFAPRSPEVHDDHFPHLTGEREGATRGLIDRKIGHFVPDLRVISDALA
jgi:hypothetical protein